MERSLKVYLYTALNKLVSSADIGPTAIRLESQLFEGPKIEH